MLVFSTPWLGREKPCVCMGLVSSPRHIQDHQTPAGAVAFYVPPTAVNCTFRGQGGDIPGKRSSNSTERGILRENKFSPLQNVPPARISDLEGHPGDGLPRMCHPPACVWLPPSHLECTKWSLSASSMTHT